MLTRFGLVALLLIVLVVIVVTDDGEPEKTAPVTLSLSTATPGGVYTRVGEAFAEVIPKYSGGLITKIITLPSYGSHENMTRLDENDTDLALIVAPVLADTPRHPVLMVLHNDVLQIVVRVEIDRLVDLREKQIILGPPDSGTRSTAERILQAANIDWREQEVGVTSYDDAFGKLKDDEADAAFFMTGVPNDGLSALLEDRPLLKLLDLGEDRSAFSILGLDQHTIPPHVYPNQDEEVRTLAARALLVCRSDLSDQVAETILDVIFEHIGELSLRGVPAQDIQLHRAFDIPDGLNLHPGAMKFRKQEEKTLQILTGSINYKYYDLGTRMKDHIFGYSKIPCRVTHTDGSLDNLRILREATRPTLAIVQYDVALAATSQPGIFQSTASGTVIEPFEGLVRVVALHEEKVHALFRKDGLPGYPPASLGDLLARVLESDTDELKVCLGPTGSGTRPLAASILFQHGIEISQSNLRRSISAATSRSLGTEVKLSVPKMAEQLAAGRINLAFFVSGAPSASVHRMLNHPSIRLLAIDLRGVNMIAGSILTDSEIDPTRYAAQDTGPIVTVSTRAVLVTNLDVNADIYSITAALFSGADQLQVGGRDALGKDLFALPMHPEAERYFKAKKILEPDPTIDWLGILWRSLGCLVILVGGWRGLITLRRDRTRNQLSNRILSVVTAALYPHSVRELFTIRREIRTCSRRRWWQRGELDGSRRKELEALVNDRVDESKENLKSSILTEARTLHKNVSLSGAELQAGHAQLEETVWTHFENGELDPSQHKLLLTVLRHGLDQVTRRRGDVQN